MIKMPLNISNAIRVFTLFPPRPPETTPEPLDVKCSASLLSDIILNEYFLLSVDCTGILFNAICIVIFALIIHQKKPDGQMYKYLLARSLCDIFTYLFTFLRMLIMSCCHSLLTTYWYQIWFIYCVQFGYCVAGQCSGFFEIAAVTDCFLTIVQKRPAICQRNLFFFLVTGLIVVSNAASYTYLILSYKIDKINFLFVIYVVREAPFYYTDTYMYWNLAESIVRDGITFIVLLVLNGLILNSLRQMTIRRRHMSERNGKASNQLVSSAAKAKRNKAIMIMCTGLLYLIGHLPFLVTLWPKAITPFWVCFNSFASLVYKVSFLFPILFYICFNKTFRNYVKFNKLRNKPVSVTRNTRSVTK